MKSKFSSYIRKFRLCNRSLQNFFMYEKHLIFFFISVMLQNGHLKQRLRLLTYFMIILFLCSCTGWQLAVNEGYTELPTQSVGDFLGGTFIDNPKARDVYSHRKKRLPTFPSLSGSLVGDISAGGRECR
jgi:hypothetical protein